MVGHCSLAEISFQRRLFCVGPQPFDPLTQFPVLWAESWQHFGRLGGRQNHPNLMDYEIKKADKASNHSSCYEMQAATTSMNHWPSNMLPLAGCLTPNEPCSVRSLRCTDHRLPSWQLPIQTTHSKGRSRPLNVCFELSGKSGD